MTFYQQLITQLHAQPKTWLVTGVAGFIGSNLLEALLKLDQQVIGLDNFATGHQHNLDEVQSLVTPAQWARFSFIEGDIRNLQDCRFACTGVDYVRIRPHSAQCRAALMIRSPVTPPTSMAS